MHRSEQNKEKYSYNGYCYVKDKESSDGERIFWRCDERYSGCKGRIWTTSCHNREFLRLVTEHSCSTTGNAARVIVQQPLTTVRQRAATTMENPVQIRSNVLQGASTAVLGQIQNKSAMRKIIKRVRLQHQDAPPNPDSRATLILPENYKNYEAEPGVNERFLLADSGEGDNERILIFGRESFEDFSHLINEIYVDGTFLICPSIFYQFFVILARREEYVIPIFYCLLPNKTENTYRRTFMMIRTIWPLLNPDSISVDFELAIHNAIRNVFPEAHIRGSQNVRCTV